MPDGLKVASDGSVWVADAHGGQVIVFNADGTHRQDVPVPLPMVTSLCFGGDDLRISTSLPARAAGRRRTAEHLPLPDRGRRPCPAAGAGRSLTRNPMKVFVFDLLAYGENLDH